ncbi:helix-turn-helix domain-containing protein [Chitinophaga agrisoli]|uniref:Helix-turn-helix domain-containing protein n=1 Tax=Chitinophaga agrisoli TaxID=2607653 RepID=A0A5B2VJP7_9BACT|nr:helix-turn-helix domain-containing protein [Chitinophaga agrisoli]KAA2238800.1 helix-turn-helix domain-containing protein [Chitinophaga agrisoli]
MIPNELNPDQQMIKDAVLNTVLAILAGKGQLTPLLSSREIIRIFRLSARELCMLRERGLIPTAKISRSFRYNPADVLELLLHQDLN